MRLHGPRIAYGNLVGVQENQWAQDDNFTIAEQHRRFGNFIRHFGDYPKEALRNLGERLSVAHGLATLNPNKAQGAATHKVSLDCILWREGIAAEKHTPLPHAPVDALQNVIRDLFAD